MLFSYLKNDFPSFATKKSYVENENVFLSKNKKPHNSWCDRSHNSQKPWNGRNLCFEKYLKWGFQDFHGFLCKSWRKKTQKWFLWWKCLDHFFVFLPIAIGLTKTWVKFGRSTSRNSWVRCWPILLAKWLLLLYARAHKFKHKKTVSWHSPTLILLLLFWWRMGVTRAKRSSHSWTPPKRQNRFWSDVKRDHLTYQSVINSTIYVYSRSWRTSMVWHCRTLNFMLHFL